MIWPALLFIPLAYLITFKSMRKLGWNVISSHILTVLIAAAAVLLVIIQQP